MQRISYGRFILAGWIVNQTPALPAIPRADLGVKVLYRHAIVASRSYERLKIPATGRADGIWFEKAGHLCSLTKGPRGKPLQYRQQTRETPARLV
jgi:hypothetical protein